MADPAEDSKTTTATAEAEAPDKSTNPDGADKADAPGDSATPAAATKPTGADDKVDEGKPDLTTDGSGSDSEGDEDAPNKKDSQAGWRLRQLTENNPALTRIRERLQPWIEDSDDPREQKDRARDVNEYIRDAQSAQDQLVRDNEQVMRDIPVFNPDAPEFRADLLQRARAQYARDMTITDQNGVTDENGNPMIVGTRMRLLDYMREKAEDYGFGVVKPGSGKQPKTTKSKAKAKMDAAADSPGGASPSGAEAKGGEEDPFLKGFDNPYARHTPTGAHDYPDR